MHGIIICMYVNSDQINLDRYIELPVIPGVFHYVCQIPAADILEIA